MSTNTQKDALELLFLAASKTTEHVTAEEFFALPEYSISVPTGNLIGKKWRRLKTWGQQPKSVEYHCGKEVKDPDEWLMGEYVEYPVCGTTTGYEQTTKVAIVWKKLKIVSPWKEKFVESIMDS